MALGRGRGSGSEAEGGSDGRGRRRESSPHLLVDGVRIEGTEVAEVIAEIILLLEIIHGSRLHDAGHRNHFRVQIANQGHVKEIIRVFFKAQPISPAVHTL